MSALGVGVGWGWIAWTLTQLFPCRHSRQGSVKQDMESDESTLIRRRAFVEKVVQAPGQSVNPPC